MMANKQLIGWLQAFVAILVFLGMNQVMGRFSAVVLQVNPVIYSCAAFSSCALVLLLYGGSGPLAKETMRSVDTWVYGIILMLSYIIGMLLFSFVTSTEGTMLQKISVFLGLIGSWFFLGRRPDTYQIIGASVITAAVALVASDLQGDNIGTICLLAFLYGALQVGRIFAAELHRPHSQAAQSRNPRAKARVIGFVMFVMSVLFLFFTFLVAVAQHMQPHNPIKGLPMLNNFLHTPTILAGLLAGVVIVAPSRLLEFASSHTIKAENFTAVTALSFVSTLFWEWATSPITGLSIKEISSTDIFAGVLITAGGLFIAFTRHKIKNKPAPLHSFLHRELQNLDAIADSRELVASALSHFSGNIKQTATALQVPPFVVQALLNDAEKTYAFRPEVLTHVARHYRRKVAGADVLTGLPNRGSFLTEIKAATYETSVFTLFYIDLDKFKPVNDTHGHAVGDAVLQQTAFRLQKLFAHRAVATRLGGDEFCVLALDVGAEKAASLVRAIQKVIAEPFVVEKAPSAGKQHIQVSASVGFAVYPTHGSTAEELFAAADKAMYEHKTTTKPTQNPHQKKAGTQQKSKNTTQINNSGIGSREVHKE